MAPDLPEPFFCALVVPNCRAQHRGIQLPRVERVATYWRVSLELLELWHKAYKDTFQRQSASKSALGGQMTDLAHAGAPATARVSDAYRWTQLAVGVLAMVMIANYQYGWTFFVPDI